MRQFYGVRPRNQQILLLGIMAAIPVLARGFRPVAKEILKNIIKFGDSVVETFEKVVNNVKTTTAEAAAEAREEKSHHHQPHPPNAHHEDLEHSVHNAAPVHPDIPESASPAADYEMDAHTMAGHQQEAGHSESSGAPAPEKSSRKARSKTFEGNDNPKPTE